MMGKNLQPKALKTQWYCHSLSLSVKDVTSRCRFLENTMDTCWKIYILIKFSPKRENILGATRWIVPGSNYKKVLDLCDILFKFWESVLQLD